MDTGYGAYSTTSYGAQGGAGGGGFMNEGSQETPGAGKRNTYEKETLRPVSIKQILDAHQPHPDAEFKIDGTEITQASLFITFVGQIRNVSHQTTNVTYKLDDGTGTVEVKQWIDSDAPTGMDMDGAKPKLVDNAYARVWGKMKAFNNRRHVGSHVIRPVTDLNEVHCHLLEAAMVHLYYTRGPPGTEDSKVGATNGGWQQNQNAYDGGNDVRMGGAQNSNLTSHARKVMQCLQTVEQSNEGLHIQDIAQRLHMDTADVSKAGDELLGQGMIYTTRITDLGDIRSLTVDPWTFGVNGSCTGDMCVMGYYARYDLTDYLLDLALVDKNNIQAATIAAATTVKIYSLLATILPTVQHSARLTICVFQPDCTNASLLL
ncbi:MAG: replication factor A protein 2 [Bogoriella megaspora]|nr:MAG: replication factor A protein 2 [Bogoriella megaspora]